MIYSKKSDSIFKRQNGQAAVEYVLVLVFIAVCVVLFFAIGQAQIGNVFSQITSSLTMDSKESDFVNTEENFVEEETETLGEEQLPTEFSRLSDSQKLLIGIISVLFFIIPGTVLFAHFFGKLFFRVLATLARLLWG